MSRARRLVGDGVCMGAAILFVIVALPLLAVALILLRAVLVVAAVIAGIGSAALYCFNPRFRGWLGRHLSLLESVSLTTPGRD